MGTPTRDIFENQGSFDPRMLVGTTLADRYKIEEMLGKGGMGAVFRATQLTIGRKVAIKIIIPSDSVPKTLEDRFFREAQIMSGLSNANIVQLYDFGQSGPILFLVMELVEGELVSSLLKRGRLASPVVREIAHQVSGGLIEAHSKGVVHRDLKPGNMLVGVGPDGRLRVKIFDFGIAYPRESEVKITKTGLMCGTPAYLAPEQIRGKEITEAADLYTLGICLFEMLTGKMPFHGATMQIMFKHVQEIPPSLGAMQDSEIPRDLGELVDHLLQKQPEDRPPSALYVRSLLEKSIDRPLELDPSEDRPLDRFLLTPINPVDKPGFRTPGVAPKPPPDVPEVSEPFKHASDEVKGAWAAFLSASDQPNPDRYDLVDPNVDNYSYTGPTGSFEPVETPGDTEWNTTNDWQAPEPPAEPDKTQIDQGLEIDIAAISNSIPATSDYQAITQEKDSPPATGQQTAPSGPSHPPLSQSRAPQVDDSARRPAARASADRTVQTKEKTIPKNAIVALVGLLFLLFIGGGLYWVQSNRFTPEEDTLSKEELEEYWQEQGDAEQRALEEAARKAAAKKPAEPTTEPGDLKKKARPKPVKEGEVIDLWDDQNQDKSGKPTIEHKK